MRKSLRLFVLALCVGALVAFTATPAIADAIILPEDEALGQSTEPEVGPEPDAWTYQDENQDGQPDDVEEPQQEEQAEQDGQTETEADEGASTTSKTGSEVDDEQVEDEGEPVELDGPGMAQDGPGVLVLVIPAIAIVAILAAFAIVRLGRKDGSKQQPSHLKRP